MNKIYAFIGFVFWMCPAFAQPGSPGLFDRVDFFVEPLAFNTKESDISPAVVRDKLYFSSVAPKYWDKPRLARSNRAFYEMYQVNLDESGNVVSDKQSPEGFGSPFHEGPVSYCPATGELFVTQSNVSRPDTIPLFFGSYEQIKLRIVIMKLIDGAWQITQELPFNDSRFHFAHPAVSATGDTLVFSSDKPGLNAQGRADLWMSVRHNGTWSGMVNAGKGINTPGNEMFPSFGPGGVLMFSSDGRQGEGMLDIYYTYLTPRAPVVSFGPQINSGADDFGLVVHPSGKWGYFASNRPGIGSDDVYKWQIIPRSRLFHAEVRDAVTREYIPDALFRVAGCPGELIPAGQSGADGKFEMNLPVGLCYTLAISAPGYIPTGRYISEIDSALFLLHRVPIVPKAAVADVPPVPEPFEGIIYFDLDKWDISPESERVLKELITVLNTHPGWKAQLASHTDTRGSVAYNDWLAKKRSESVVTYLTLKGIDRSRLLASDFGEMLPVNPCADGVSCPENDHRRNRRTEIRVTGY